MEQGTVRVAWKKASVAPRPTQGVERMRIKCCISLEEQAPADPQDRIAYHRPDYERLSADARALLLADLERHYFASRYTCAAFDPTPWVALAQAQLPLQPQVAEALARCTRHWSDTDLFSYFQDPDAPDRKPRARIFFLHCPRNGRLIFDADAHGAILGVEYLDLALRHGDQEVKAGFLVGFPGPWPA